MDNDKAINGLLAMAEYFRTQHQVKEAIHCLLAALELKLSPRVEMRSRLQLSLLLHHHTTNSNEAINHLEKVMVLGRSSGQVAELHEIRFEAASLMARIYAEQSSYQQAKSILRKVLDSSTHFPYWYLRLTLQLADMNACERDTNAVIITLSKAVEFSQLKGAVYTQLMCLLCKGSYLLTLKNYAEAGQLLNQCHTILGSYTGPHCTLLHSFYLVIQVAHLLSADQVKLAKPHLRLLQQKVKVLNSEPRTTNDQTELSANDFEWLSREHIFVLVYLVSSIHALSCGNAEKAVLYGEKALQITAQQPDNVDIQVFNVLKSHVMETLICCKLVEGKFCESLNLLGEVLKCCHSHPKLSYSHRSSIHTLIGLYSLGTGNNLDQAVAQFHCALQHTNVEALRLYVSLNLAIAYMKIGPAREAELSALVSSIQPDQESLSQSLKAAAYYVKGLYSFTILKLHDAKHCLKETLAIASDADLNKLTASALVLLAQIYLALGTRKEAKDMASPALEIAQKTKDSGLQLWAAFLIADLQRMSGDLTGEATSRSLVNSVSKHMTKESSDCRAHPLNSCLLQWTTGEWPVARLPQLHVHSNGTTVLSMKETPMDSSTSVAAGNTVTMTGGSTETLTGSSYTQLYHIGNYSSHVQQAYPAQGHQHVGGQQVHLGSQQVHLGSQQAHQGNPGYQSNYSAQPVHPAYQVNPGQFSRHLHHYPTQVNTSYSPSSLDVLHHQMEHLHAAHPHQAHHYGNSGFSFKR